MSDPEAANLVAEVEVACAVCGRDAQEVVCRESEVRAQLAYLERFHRRRLRPMRKGSAEAALADRADFTQDYTTDIVRCSACGLVFREARPRASEVAAAYEHDRYGRERLEALFDSQLELFRGKTERLERVLSTRRPRMVEIGSFVGGFLGAARERGWDAVGVDPGEEVAEFCRERGFAVLQSTAAEAPIGEGEADLVAIWNTFDQIPEPRPTLTAVRRWLRPNGILAVRVPNGECFRRAIAALRRTPPPFRGPLLAAMAWNNLLAFPYLHGHSVATLDRLLAPFDLARVAVDPDTLTRLADERTRLWAAWEERLSKAVWRALAKAAIAEPPWLDAYYRRLP
jgi:SAM-dependent methyltransferase